MGRINPSLKNYLYLIIAPVLDNALLQGEAVSCCNQRLPSAEARAGQECCHANEGQHAVQSVLIRSILRNMY